MSKRNILKIIAFVVGLYFFLEYILPEKVGGEFDSYEVNSPVCVEKQGQKLQFYVGNYYKGRGIIGRMVRKDGAWKKDPKPVLQRSLFLKFDQYGLAEPDCAITPEGLTLLYMGQNEKEPVLCFAESKDDALTAAVAFSEGNADAAESQSVGQGLLFREVTKWRRQRGHVAHVGSDGLQACRGELQTVVERVVGRHLCQVGSVGGEYLLLTGDDGVGHIEEDGVALVVG